jgi:hypothetical protein
METEKDHVKTDDKRVYRSPQLTAFGSVANVTRVNTMSLAVPDNPQMSNSMGNDGSMVIS